MSIIGITGGEDVGSFVVNTYIELEAHAIAALAGGLPRRPAPPGRGHEEILGWLDEQPESSVAFLCFGMNGYFDEAQVTEMASALERNGTRFLWSLRKPPSKETGAGIGEYMDPGKVLPDGFLDRTV
ncbi:hypothetical protein SASPL_132346 [Salvia splendens]|uniref:Uncharacterized protein n=1 Tax=Salvia splendens TaxID=180675 RepID=A0A8X8X0Z6_SALSN|nr:hypothetical protein SASPL_132346 [Salvia splendens]